MFPALPPTPPLKSVSPLPNVVSAARSPVGFTGPLDATGQPVPDGDPSAAWERQRAAWLGRRRPEGVNKAEPRDPAFRDKLGKLEDLLSGKALAREDDGPGGKAKARESEQAEDDDEPDGGMVVGRAGKGIEKEGELRKAGEAILLAFKQGRALKDPLPLSLVTKLLYRSWLTDGTIPADYVPPPLDLPPPSPTLVAASSSTPSERPHTLFSHPSILSVPPLSYAASLYSAALPMPHLERERMTPSPLPQDLNEGTETEGKTIPPPPIAQFNSQVKGGIDLGEEGKIRVGAITSGGSWRTEKDIASGSDLI